MNNYVCFVRLNNLEQDKYDKVCFNRAFNS